MLEFNEKTKLVSRRTEPVTAEYAEIRRRLGGLVYRPAEPGANASTAVVIMHSDTDYTALPMAAQLAARGFTVYAGRVAKPNGLLDDKLADLGAAVSFVRSLPGVRTVALMGHSGGATLMSAYQAIAENGPEIFQGEGMVYRCRAGVPPAPADLLMLIDANMGNGPVTLMSIDPAVTEEGSSRKLETALDIFSEANGWRPEGAAYSEEFLSAFFAAQRARNNRLIERAAGRLRLIESGKGDYADDEPFPITGGAQSAPCNKLLPQDVRLLSHTRAPHDLLHGDGTVSHEIVRSLRKPAPFGNQTPSFWHGTAGLTVRSFLSEFAAPALEGYAIGEDGVSGIAFDQSYSSAPGNVAHIRVPLLAMGMTGGWEYIAAEEIYDRAASRDRTIAFVEGADHLFNPEKAAESFPGQFGDTGKTLYDYMAAWLEKH